MGMMGTLAKVALGYAAARGVDRMSGGQGLGSLLRGRAQVPGSEPGTSAQSQFGQALGGAGSPLGGLLDQFRSSGLAGASGAGLAGTLAAAAGGSQLGKLFDQFNAGEAAPEAERSAALMLRAMIQAAKADGAIDAAEKARLMETLGEDASPEDIAFVREQLAAPLDPEALAADTPEALRSQVYSASLMTIELDTADEAEYLDSLAKAMKLPETTVNALHMQMGVTPLYS